MNKAVLEDFLAEMGVTGVAATVKVGDKELNVMVLTGSLKKGDEVVDSKIWLCDEVPGGIVKRLRTTKVNGEVAAETTVELVSYKKGD
jgi:hypothetical protein